MTHLEELMTLDLVLGGSSLTWLATEEEKIRPLTEVCRVPRSALPGTWYPGRAPFVGTVRYFVDKVPMSVREDGEVAFAYVQGLDHSLIGIFSMAVLPHPYGLFGSAFEPASEPRHGAPIDEENGR